MITMERKVGTVARGIRCPIIRQGDDLAAIVVNSVLEAAEQEGFSLQDTVDNDPVRQKPLPGNSVGVGPMAAFAAVHSHAASIGIIGGADGPVSLYVREKALPLCHTAFSALHFQPAEQVTWLPVFQERPCPEQLVPLEKKE